ncbi:hypothetical protein [Rhodococcus spelaei]|nr:hypothetical protein [Rhodococcus spelaei]
MDAVDDGPELPDVAQLDDATRSLRDLQDVLDSDGGVDVAMFALCAQVR